MSAISCVVLVAVVTVMAGASSDKPHYDVNNAPSLFEQYVKDYNKSYKDETDRKVHYDAFVKNLHKINDLNAKNTGAVFGLNKFADYTEEESKQMRGLKQH